ncbi:hypothetical protein [Roseateles sp. BYS96W]|uniref:Uncharacterized protein n=1 Tax=Pelomonas nitida TaxID=3299027 RepID=A0ABW7GB22_9BURK
MSEDAGSKIGRFIVAALLMVGTLGFGAAGLCGAAFTALSLPALLSSGTDNYVGAVFVIAIPSLLIGGGLAWWCGRLLLRQARRNNSSRPEEQ